ncbi:MAG: hypothetical protein ACP5QT_06535 [Brevinematia bacterium]
MKKIISVLFLMLFFDCIYSGETISLNGKKLNFILDTSRCSFYIENPYPVDNRSKLLLFRDTPPTSYISLYIDGMFYRLNEKDLNMKEAFSLYDNYIMGEFVAKNIKITIFFILTNLGRRGFEDTLLYIINLENAGTNSHNLDVRFLFDTVLGEERKSPALFTLGGEKIESDRIFEEGTIPVIFSGNVDTLDMEFRDGLYIYPAINNFNPKRLIVGNWKKLNTMRNVFLPEPRARFRYNPYSNPDAAVCTIYRFKLSSLEKLAFGCALSLDKIPEEKLKFKLEDFIPQISSIAKTETKEKEKETESKITNIIPSLDTNEISVLNEKLLLYKKLNALIDKIEEKFFSTNLMKEEAKISQQPPQAFVVITNIGGVADTNQLELLNKEITRLQNAYENRLKELQNHYESKIKEKEKANEKPPKSKKDIDKKIEQIDKSLLLLEKLMKFNVSSLPEDKISELKSNIIDIEKEINNNPE